MAVSPRSARRLRAILGLLGALALAVVAERWHWFDRLLASAGPQRLWIWTVDPPGDVRPLAFTAARDFEVDRRPSSAVLSVIGDPEYVVWVNGERVGSGAYRSGAAFNRYEVAPLLRTGRNRVVLDLRSPIGAGAASLRVEDDTGRALVATDHDWFVYRQYWRGLWNDEELWPTERARVLGAAPIGRWGLPAEGPIRPRFSEVLEIDTVVGASHYLTGDPPTVWVNFGSRRRSRPPIGPRAVIDFKRTVSGYLHVEADGDDSEAALVRFGDQAHAGDGWLPDAVAITLAGRRFWQDVVPRRFRYVEIVGFERLRWAGVMPVTESGWNVLPRATGGGGLIGVSAEPVRLPVVSRIWRSVLPPG